MFRPELRVSSLLRPKDEALTIDGRTEVQVYRLMCLLGALLLPAVGFLHRASGLEVVAPMWARFGILGAFTALFGVSYVSEKVRHCYAKLSWGLLYLMMVGVTVLAVVNQFVGEYAVVFLFAYALFGGLVALGSESLSPVLWFLLVGFLLLGGAFLWAPTLQTSPLILGGVMAFTALFEGIATRWMLSIRERLAGQERELREQQDLLDRLLETSPNAIVRLGRDGTFVQVSGQAEEAFGLGEEKLLGRFYNDPAWEIATFSGKDMPEEEMPFARVLQSGRPVRGQEISVERPDGTQRFLSIRGAPLCGEDGEVHGGIFHLRDVTEREHRGQALRQARQEAEEAARLKSALLANMNHELRTPLTAIIGFAEAVGTEAREVELPEGSPLPGYANLIEQSGKRLLETLEGVLDLSQLEAGEMELNAEPVDLGDQARRAVEELRPEAQEKEIDLQLEARGAEARADENGVQIVLQNLVSNAIKYTKEGGTVWVRTYLESDRAVLEVEDTGAGMEPEMVDRLFKPFRQASVGPSREYEGTGVGLTVTKKATEQMGGSIDVETEDGEGSRFIAQLPIAENGAMEREGDVNGRSVAKMRQ
jgi:PAS domain S-box-containing protein